MYPQFACGFFFRSQWAHCRLVSISKTKWYNSVVRDDPYCTCSHPFSQSRYYNDFVISALMTYYEKSKLFTEKFNLSVINQNRNLYGLPKIVKEMQIKTKLYILCMWVLGLDTHQKRTSISLMTAVNHTMWLRVIEPRTSGKRASALNLSSHLSSP